MGQPALNGSVMNSASGRSARTCALLVLSGLATLAAVGDAPAQTTKPSAGAAGAHVEATASNVEGVSDIKPDMTVDQLVAAGSAAVAGGRLEEGRKVLLAAVARDGRNLPALSALAFAYERSAEQVRGEGGGFQATAQADRFIDQAVDVYLTAGAVATEQELVGVAEQFFNRILLHRPGNAKALLGLARIYSRTERRIQAIDRYKDYLASTEGSRDARGYLELGELYLDGTHWRLAMDQFLRAQSLQPGDADVDMGLARAHWKGDRMAEAMEYAKSACGKAPERAKYPHLLAELHLAQRNGEQAGIEALRAIELARKALQGAPENLSLLQDIGRYYDTYEKALGLVLNEGKADLGVRVDLARAVQEHAAVGQQLALRRALKILTDALPANQDNARLLEELAAVRRALGMTQEARETCLRLLGIDPGNAVAARMLKEMETAGKP